VSYAEIARDKKNKSHASTPVEPETKVNARLTHDGFALPSLRSLTETARSLEKLIGTIAYIDGTRMEDASKLFKKFLTQERIEQLFSSEGASGFAFTASAVQKWLDVVYNPNYSDFVENSVIASERVSVASKNAELKAVLHRLGFDLTETRHLRVKTPARAPAIPFEHLILAVSLVEEASFCDATARGAKVEY
jgi:hypothetical protein